MVVQFGPRVIVNQWSGVWPILLFTCFIHVNFMYKGNAPPNILPECMSIGSFQFLVNDIWQA